MSRNSRSHSAEEARNFDEDRCAIKMLLNEQQRRDLELVQHLPDALLESALRTYTRDEFVDWFFSFDIALCTRPVDLVHSGKTDELTRHLGVVGSGRPSNIGALNSRPRR